MKMPFEEATFDAVYAIEATCHAPSAVGVYKEIFRVSASEKRTKPCIINILSVIPKPLGRLWLPGFRFVFNPVQSFPPRSLPWKIRS